MYSLVLAALLTSGNAVPDWGCRGGCHGCWGGCYGCRGGCYGCWGGCYGCGGGCYGCWGCGGGCYGSWGGCWGCGGGFYSGCYGCGGCGGMVVLPAASAYTVAPVVRTAAIPPTQQLQDLKRSLEELKKEQNQMRKTLEGLKRSPETSMQPEPQRGDLPTAPASARITVHLPEDAKLTVDGVDCPLTSQTRTFDTPALPPDQKYYYLLKAEVVRDGRPIAQTRRVDFRPGERVTVSFENLGAKLVTTR